MDVLVLGWSDIVRRRVLPAFGRIDDVGRVHVATQSRTAPDLTALGARAGRAYTGVDAIARALVDLPDALVYVSGHNTVHADRVLAALGSGHDVVVDKPAFLSAAERDRCLAAATSEHRMVAEALVWPRHAQVAELLDRMRSMSLRAKAIRATFAIPELPGTNFRTNPALGGGAVADMGVYAMSPARVFGDGELEQVTGRVIDTSDNGVDRAFTFAARYSDEISVEGTFALTGDYVNRLELTGEDWHAVLQPAFSSRPDAELAVDFTVRGQDRGFTVAPSDPFAAFLADVARGRDDRAAVTARTAVSSDDLLALASALGVDWDRRRPPGHGEDHREVGETYHEEGKDRT